jgi:long-chain acyl-CoA synthetase
MDGREPYPGGVPYSVNYPEIPLHAFLKNSARKFPDRDAVIFLGRRITYSQLWDDARRLATGLRGLGVEKGDRVGLLLPNVPQFIIAYNAVLAARGIVVAINPLNPNEEVNRELQETEAETIIVLDRLLDKLPEVRPENIIVAETTSYAPWHLKLMNKLRYRSEKTPSGALRFEKLLEAHRLEPIAEVNPRRDLAVIQYTGGTTGPPKGVMLTHSNLVANALQSFFWIRGWGFSEKPQPAGWPVVVCAVPFFHIYGMTVAMNEAVQFGCTLVLVPDPKPEAIMKAIQRYSVTHFPAIPQMIQEILEHPLLTYYDLTNLTSCLSGGASIDPGLVKRFVEVTGATFYHGYGLTEAGPTTHCTPFEGAPNNITAGLPFPDTEAKIVDTQTGEIELPPGEEGELIVRGPQVMFGYWRKPEETVRALRGGWLYTGDIARLDEEGYLYIVDRKIDRIISEGHTVWPSKVEQVLESHPAVESAVILGIPDPLRCATDIRAVVTLKHGRERKEVERVLPEFYRERLEPYETPIQIIIVDHLPRTPLGKVDRRALRLSLMTSQASRRS